MAKACEYPYKEKEEYLEEIQTVLSTVENYKVRFFYCFIMGMLEVPICVEGGADNE